MTLFIIKIMNIMNILNTLNILNILNILNMMNIMNTISIMNIMTIMYIIKPPTLMTDPLTQVCPSPLQTESTMGVYIFAAGGGFGGHQPICWRSHSLLHSDIFYRSSRELR